jgi:hypothetical protein
LLGADFELSISRNNKENSIKGLGELTGEAD